MTYKFEILGGILIGIASALPLLVEGRISGVSGYAASAMRFRKPEGRTSFLFIAGIILGGVIWHQMGGVYPEPTPSQLSPGAWALAGILIGFGSRLGGGCTSGHGVCGIGRLSPRSILSVTIFIPVAAATTFLMRVLL